MNTAIRGSLLLASLILSFNVMAQVGPGFHTNPRTPYPPGCAIFDPDSWIIWYHVESSSETSMMTLTDSHGVSIATEISFWRQYCGEAGQTLLMVWIDFDDAETTGTVTLPTLALRTGGAPAAVNMRLVRDVNTYWGDPVGMQVGTDRGRLFFVDNPGASVLAEVPFLGVAEYNGELEFVMTDPVGGQELEGTIAASPGDLFFDEWYLNGRMSGIWVAPGAADQGFFLSVNELPGGQLYAYLALLTYDSAGHATWVSGIGLFDVYTRGVELDMMVYDGGRFLAADPAEGAHLGQATLTTVGCAELRFEYDLGDMGSGSRSLQRLFGSEIAGYACSPRPRGPLQ